MAAGQFREDLFFRLSVFQIHIPPLRDRREDIPALAEHFLRQSRLADVADARLSDDVLDELRSRPWAGNIRELRNAIEHAAIVARGRAIRREHLPAATVRADETPDPGRNRAPRAGSPSGPGEQVQTPPGLPNDASLYERFLELVEPPVLGPSWSSASTTGPPPPRCSASTGRRSARSCGSTASASLPRLIPRSALAWQVRLDRLTILRLQFGSPAPTSDRQDATRTDPRTTMISTDVAIIGGGIVGLATAYQLTRELPGRKVVVLEKEAELAHHQTGHNSGVLHSGIYYKPGSLKAINCRQGKRLMEEFCAAEGISYEICGKVIVALDESELPALERIFERGQANGVVCEVIGRERLAELEPHAAGVKAIHVPEAGIVNYRQVCQRLAERVRERDGEVLTSARVTKIDRSHDKVVADDHRRRGRGQPGRQLRRACTATA